MKNKMNQANTDRLEHMIRSDRGMVRFRENLVEIVSDHISGLVEEDLGGVGTVESHLSNMVHGELLNVVISKVPNYKKKFVKAVNDEVERLIGIFIVKQIQKICPIVGNRRYKAEIEFFEGNKLSKPGGWLTLSFKNKSSFRMKTRLVFCTSKFDLMFTRYPSTFHNVKVEGEKPDERVSWEWMVENFK